MFVVTELKRRHRQVAGHRTMNKLINFPILPQRYKFVKQFVHTKFV